ncbi:hypothetical protein DKP78_21575, partial [Enterococcus faecium]
GLGCLGHLDRHGVKVGLLRCGNGVGVTAGLAVDRIVAGAVVAGCRRQGGLVAGGDSGGVQRRACLGPLQTIDGGVAARGHRVGDGR